MRLPSPNGESAGTAPSPFGDRLEVAALDPVAQHRCALDGTTASTRAGVSSCSAGRNSSPGLVQNWPTPRVKEPTKPATISGPRTATAPRDRKDRVHAAELAVEGDRFGTGVGDVEEGAAGGGRPGEGGRLDPRVGEGAGAGLHAMHDGDRGAGRSDDLTDGAPKAWVAGMGLHDHRAAGGERSGGVAAGHREREGEVAGRKHQDRADRLEHTAQVRPRAQGEAGIGVLDDCVEAAAFDDRIGEESQLERGPGKLAGQPRQG